MEKINLKSILSSPYDKWVVGLMAFIFFLPFIGHIHLFDWDEINFAESSREMIVSENYQWVQINFTAFWEKPPFFFWLQVLSMKIFGISEFAARFPNVIIGVITFMLLFYIARKHHNKTIAWFWVLAMLGSFTPHIYYKSGIIDPTFNLLILSSIYLFFCYWKTTGIKFLCFSALSLGLAILTKGPTALVIGSIVILIYAYLKKQKLFAHYKHALVFILLLALFPLCWFGYEVKERGLTFIVQFTDYQWTLLTQPVATHGQPIYYHFLVLLLGCFPASIFAIRQLGLNKIKFKKTSFHSHHDLGLLMKILFWTVLILFSLVTTKIIHYSSLCYFPLTYFAAKALYQHYHKKIDFRLWEKILFGFIGFVYSLLFILLPFASRGKQKWLELVADPFIHNALEMNVQWQGWEFIIGCFFCLLIIYFIVFIASSKSLLILFFGIAIFINLFLSSVLPKVEQYTQGPAIEFFKSLQAKDCYWGTYGYKSYAPAFYGQIPKERREETYHSSFLLYGYSDKEVYLSVKKDYWQKHPLAHFNLLYCQGGFCFIYRKAGGVKAAQ